MVIERTRIRDELIKSILDYNSTCLNLYPNLRGAFYDFDLNAAEANWSADLEDMHDEYSTNAHPIDYYDRFMMHVRRYGKKELLSKVSQEGFNVLKHNFLSCIPYIPFYVHKKMNRLKHKSIMESDIQVKVSKDINSTRQNYIMNMIFKIDFHLSKHIKFPFGIREIILVKK